VVIFASVTFSSNSNAYIRKFMPSTTMRVYDKNYRTIWIKEGNEEVISIIDQRFLPHRFATEDIHSASEMTIAIKDMHVRGAGLIGAAAGYGMYLAAIEAKEKNNFEHLFASAEALKATRPTAVNLAWAVNRQLTAMAQAKTPIEKTVIARQTADLIADEDAEYCRNIGLHGVRIIEEISKRKKGRAVNIMTHCNAGWLAFVDYGSATAPIYEAFKRGIDLHVWVDETRPRNQGASLTAWELINQGIPHTIIVDNAGGHLMQHGLVDMVITGADRVTVSGDAANKIGTYLKALAAHDNGIPFYVALPSSTFDWDIRDGVKDIHIEERNADEVKYVYGLCDGEIKKVLITPSGSPAGNYGFDVTPARLITGLITERGICKAREEDITRMYAEKVQL
jgi:methylthioribose-1-phosphate isomerase